MHNRAYKDFESSIDPIREFNEITNNLNTYLAQIQTALNNYDAQYVDAIEKLNQMIVEQESAFLKKSIDVYQDSINGESDDAVLNRKINISDQDRAWYAHRLHVLSSWQTPALFIRPGSESWLNHLVSNDPLYLVDKNHSLLKPCQEGYHDVYKRRLRQYIIDENQEDFLTSQLPLAQFGLVFAWNYFELRHVAILEKYVSQVAKLLRPGGVFAFSYNNCDHEHGVRLINHHCGTYITFDMISNIAVKNNLTVSLCQPHNNIGWVELKSPGEISSLRGGQSLAKIIARSK
jgi:SAM-dependent methyltransferase